MTTRRSPLRGENAGQSPAGKVNPSTDSPPTNTDLERTLRDLRRELRRQRERIRAAAEELESSNAGEEEELRRNALTMDFLITQIRHWQSQYDIYRKTERQLKGEH